MKDALSYLKKRKFSRTFYKQKVPLALLLNPRGKRRISDFQDFMDFMGFPRSPWDFLDFYEIFGISTRFQGFQGFLLDFRDFYGISWIFGIQNPYDFYFVYFDFIFEDAHFIAESLLY